MPTIFHCFEKKSRLFEKKKGKDEYARHDQVFFWGVHTGAELDLLLLQNGRRLGFEIKLTRSPQVTPSMRSAREVLGLNRLYVIFHGNGDPWPLAEGITAVPAMCLAHDWRP